MRFFEYFKWLVLPILIISANIGTAQRIWDQNYAIELKSGSIRPSIQSDDSISIFKFDEFLMDRQHPEIPFFAIRIPVPGFGSMTGQLDVLQRSPVQVITAEGKKAIREKGGLLPSISFEIEQERNQYFAVVKFLPFAEDRSGGYQFFKEFRLQVDFRSEPFTGGSRNEEFGRTSVLADGEIYKVSVDRTGVHRLDRAALERLGINVGTLDPRNIKIYGNPGGMMPELIATPRIDDLQELAIQVIGEGDGRFDAGDAILFFGTGADHWNYDPSLQEPHQFSKNIYDTKNFYFIKISGSRGKRVENGPSIGTPAQLSSGYTVRQRFEDDRVNLLGRNPLTQGSGKLWFGDQFTGNTERDYANQFDFSNRDVTAPIRILGRFAARSDRESNGLLAVGSAETSVRVSPVSLTNIEGVYANLGVFNTSTTQAAESPRVNFAFRPTVASAEAWIDFIQLIFRKNLSGNLNQAIVFDERSLEFPTYGFQLSTPSANLRAWDITDNGSVRSYELSSGSFAYEVDNQLRFFVFFNENQAFTPTTIGRIPNQNLHALDDLDMVVVYPAVFKDVVDRYVAHRSATNGLNIKALEVNEIYHEFSSGRQDPTAIRNLARMLHKRTDKFRYLLLFGDGTYDQRAIVPNLPDHRLVPAYHTDQSMNPIRSFPTDDYYALLSDNEGGNLRGALDIGVGRITVTTVQEAEAVLNKIITYDQDPDRFGDWRINTLYAADDEDSNLHLNQTDRLAVKMERQFPHFVQQKVFFDAFQQVSTPGGERFPQATEQINNNFFKGLLVFCYLGHGGPRGLAQERVMRVDDVLSWTNLKKLVLMVTATCSLTGYDDPSIVSAGEHALLNPRGGAIALLTTTRAVYASQNERLTNSAFDFMFTKENDFPLTFGDIITRAKNNTPQDTVDENARKFALIGDPSQRIALPRFNIQFTKINGVETSQFIDTIRALQTVRIEGEILDNEGKFMESFNGIISPTIFDKASRVFTLGTDQRSFVTGFDVYRNILFRGNASVTAGRFSFEFVVPKDINYAFGPGKVTAFAASNNQTDATGANTNFIIGGSDDSVVADDKGPEIKLFMNDEQFVFGGITDANPTLLVKLSDDLGINITGNSVGHDLTARLEGPVSGNFVMNEFFEATLDKPNEGVVRFPLSKLEEGKYAITVRAWDVANNSAESRTEFVVTNPGNKKLENVYNYPNPFTTNTEFMFEHDLSNQELDYIIHIYTVSGKLVKTISGTSFSRGNRLTGIQWNGRDDFDQKIGRGVYMYKINVKSPALNASRESEFRKLVLL